MLSQLGLRYVSWDRQAFGWWLQNRHDELFQTVSEFDSFEDWPWPLIYQEIDVRYPGSKFILTRRKDAATWFRSICKHADWTGPHEVNRHVYGYELPYGHQAEHCEFYENYLVSVRKYFRDRPEALLEVCWEDGDGWPALCEFLDFEQPTIPFPHANKSPTLFDQWMYRVNRYRRKLKRRAARILTQVGKSK